MPTIPPLLWPVFLKNSVASDEAPSDLYLVKPDNGIHIPVGPS